MNPRSQLSDEYFSLSMVRFYLDRIKIKRISNPKAVIPLTNIEVWALARVIDAIEEEYVPKFGGTSETPYVIEGVKRFLNPLIIPNGTSSNHAVNLSQLNGLASDVNNAINVAISNLTEYINNEISDLEMIILQYQNTINQRLDGIDQAIDDLQNRPVYTHPTVGGRSETFTGAEVFAQFTSNVGGHVTSTSRRTLTLADLGYNGSTDANFYEHPTGFGNTPPSPLEGSNVISQIIVNNQGHVTGVVTKDLSLSNLGGEPAFGKGSIITAGNSGISISGELANRLVGLGDLIFSLSTDVIREANINTITGLKTFRRAGTNDGLTSREVIKFDISENVDLYQMFIMNSQNQNAPNGEVNWWFSMAENYGGTRQIFDHLGFHRGGITVIGGYLPTQLISIDIQTWVNANLGTRLPYPISTYIKRNMMVEGRGYFGKNNLDETLVLDSSDYLYSSGKSYAKLGFRGRNPRNEDLNGPTWEFGSVEGGLARIRINGVSFNVTVTAV